MPGNDFEVWGCWVGCQYAWEILASFRRPSHRALSCKINYLPLSHVCLNLKAVKKINCPCFIKMKLRYNVTFAISTESLCMPIDPAVVMATWTTKPLRSCCYGSPWNSWGGGSVDVEGLWEAGLLVLPSHLDPKTPVREKRQIGET